jgi:hypothetical protein
MSKPEYIEQFVGNYRVRMWGDGINETHYFNEEKYAMWKYMALVQRQASGELKLNRVVLDVLFDYGDGKLGFKKVLDSRREG